MNSYDWSGNILIGNDGYPKKKIGYGDSYLIAGGWDVLFKAIAIEFYGVK